MAREAPLDGLNGGIWNILKKMLLLEGRLRGLTSAIGKFNSLLCIYISQQVVG